MDFLSEKPSELGKKFKRIPKSVWNKLNPKQRIIYLKNRKKRITEDKIKEEISETFSEYSDNPLFI